MQPVQRMRKNSGSTHLVTATSYPILNRFTHTLSLLFVMDDMELLECCPDSFAIAMYGYITLHWFFGESDYDVIRHNDVSPLVELHRNNFTSQKYCTNDEFRKIVDAKYDYDIRDASEISLREFFEEMANSYVLLPNEPVTFERKFATPDELNQDLFKGMLDWSMPTSDTSSYVQTPITMITNMEITHEDWCLCNNNHLGW